MHISSLSPIFGHLLESSHRDDSKLVKLSTWWIYNTSRVDWLYIYASYPEPWFIGSIRM